MVPGISERAARAAELGRRGWLDEAQRGQAWRAPAPRLGGSADDTPHEVMPLLVLVLPPWARTTARRALAALASGTPCRPSARRRATETTPPSPSTLPLANAVVAEGR